MFYFGRPIEHIGMHPCVVIYDDANFIHLDTVIGTEIGTNIEQRRTNKFDGQ